MMRAVFLVFLIAIANCTKIDPKELKCLVCEKTVEEMGKFVEALDPNIRVDVGGYRLDGVGNLKKSTVPQTKSEVHLSDILDKVCEKMDDYVRATWKSDGKLTLLKLIGADGQMSPDMGNVDIIQDGDLNKSLKYYCEQIVEDHEDSLIKNFVNGHDDVRLKVCSLDANLCSNPEEDFGRNEL